jgi:hypothetical protein
MKKSIFLFLFYCIVQGDGYFCKPVDFEIREYPTKNSDAAFSVSVSEKYQCRHVHDGWKCIPFDKGAILMDTPSDFGKIDSYKFNNIMLTPAFMPSSNVN